MQKERDLSRNYGPIFPARNLNNKAPHTKFVGGLALPARRGAGRSAKRKIKTARLPGVAPSEAPLFK